jgi:hypothetical protein
MTTKPNENNPHRSPTASITVDVPARGDTLAVDKQSSWRILPVGVTAVYGALATVIGLSFVGTFVLSYCGGPSLSRADGSSLSNAQHVFLLIVGILTAASGFTAIVAAKRFWNSRWRQGAILVLVAAILAVAAPAAMAAMYVANRLLYDPPLIKHRENGQSQYLKRNHDSFSPRAVGPRLFSNP